MMLVVDTISCYVDMVSNKGIRLGALACVQGLPCSQPRGRATPQARPREWGMPRVGGTP